MNKNQNGQEVGPEIEAKILAGKPVQLTALDKDSEEKSSSWLKAQAKEKFGGGHVSINVYPQQHTAGCRITVHLGALPSGDGRREQMIKLLKDSKLEFSEQQAAKS